MDLTTTRRSRQEIFNKAHGITPRTVKRAVQESLYRFSEAQEAPTKMVHEDMDEYDIQEVVRQLEEEMLEAAASLEFERAAVLRDQIKKLEKGAEPSG